MSTSQARVLDFINLEFGDRKNDGVSAGLRVAAKISQMIGIDSGRRRASTSDAATVQAVAVTSHKWAAKVGKYNDDPIWGEIFRNVQENRRHLKEQLNDLA